MSEREKEKKKAHHNDDDRAFNKFEAMKTEQRSNMEKDWESRNSTYSNDGYEANAIAWLKFIVK